MIMKSKPKNIYKMNKCSNKTCIKNLNIISDFLIYNLILLRICIDGFYIMVLV